MSRARRGGELKTPADAPTAPVGAPERGEKPPKPTLVQTKRPKRLLIDGLTLHLRPCACDVDCTIVIMGDLNTDVISRTGYDNRALQTMTGDLGLVSCADARWPASSCVFKTHKGGHWYLLALFTSQAHCAFCWWLVAVVGELTSSSFLVTSLL